MGDSLDSHQKRLKEASKHIGKRHLVSEGIITIQILVWELMKAHSRISKLEKKVNGMDKH